MSCSGNKSLSVVAGMSSLPGWARFPFRARQWYKSLSINAVATRFLDKSCGPAWGSSSKAASASAWTRKPKRIQKESSLSRRRRRQKRWTTIGRGSSCLSQSQSALLVQGISLLLELLPTATLPPTTKSNNSTIASEFSLCSFKLVRGGRMDRHWPVDDWRIRAAETGIALFGSHNSSRNSYNTRSWTGIVKFSGTICIERREYLVVVPGRWEQYCTIVFSTKQILKLQVIYPPPIDWLLDAFDKIR